MQNNGIQVEKSEEIGTILYIAVDNQYVGHIIISDKIKQDSYKAIKCLKSININNIIMLTEVHSELLPTDKAEKLEEILESKSSNKNVAFVGDGINDSPVLALADVGIAMGGLGADSAIEAADIILMTDEPSKIVDAIKLSRKTIKIVKSNIIFALAIKIVVLLLSAFGISTMWMAIFADVGVSMLCILNSLRALKTQKC